MLVLKRKRSQRVLIGREIILTILGTSKNGVRLGIEAPPDVLVLRDELTKDAGAMDGQQTAQAPIIGRAGHDG